MLLALAAFLCIASGFALVSLSSPRRARLASDLDLLLRASLSVGYGLGIFSVIFFLARAVGVTNLGASDLLLLDLLIFTLLLVSFFVIRTRATNRLLSARQRLEKERKFDVPPGLHRSVTAAFVVDLCASVYAAAMRSLAHPHGEGWDAFAIWNLHARFLLLGSAHWRDGFSPLIPWSHPDYPLLLPAAIAHFWTYLGHDDPAVPAVISLVFSFSTAGLLFSALSIMRGRTAAMLGAIALLTTPFFIEQGSSQYADVPLSFFLLATIALLCLHDDDSADPHPVSGLLVLAGLAAGFAAWTKNEGLLFLCAILVARIGILLRTMFSHNPSQRPRRERLHENWISVATFLSGVAPVFLVIAWFKLSVAPPSELFSNSATRVHKLLDPTRYWVILKWFVKGFFLFGHWLLLPGTLLLMAFYFAAPAKEHRKSGIGFRSSVLALALTLGGYFAIYLITPYDLYWHLRFSLTRLFLQLWPSAILLLFLSLAPRSHKDSSGCSQESVISTGAP